MILDVEGDSIINKGTNNDDNNNREEEIAQKRDKDTAVALL